jgi:hypothetical protein
MYSIDVNWFAIILAAIGSMMIGALWYSKALFGKQWLKEIGKTEEQIKAENTSNKAMAGAAVLALVMSIVLAHQVAIWGATTVWLGAQVGFWHWIGFIVPAIGMITLFESRSKKLYAINISYQLASMVLMSVILAIWR